MGYDEDKKEIDDKLSKIDTVTEAITKLTSKVDGQESLTQTFKQEIGEVRKDLKTLTESGFNPEEVKKLVDKMEELSKTIPSLENKEGKGGTKTEEEWDEKDLSEAAKAKADEVFSKLEPEARDNILANPEERTKFLKTAQDATEEVPDSLFKKPVKKEPTINEYRQLFGLANKDASHLPGGTQSAGRFVGAKTGISTVLGSQEATRRLPDGKIPRGNQPKK